MKYIVKNCPAYLLGKCNAFKMPTQKCMNCTNCTTKQIINEAIQYQDAGRIDLINESKHLSERGQLVKKILKILDVEEIKEEVQA